MLHASSTPRQDPTALLKATLLSSSVPCTGKGRNPIPASGFSQRLARSLPWVQGGLWGARATICWSRHAWTQHQPSPWGPSPAFGSCLGWGSPDLGWVTSQLCLQLLRGLCFCLSRGPSWQPDGQSAHCPSVPEAHIASPVPAFGKAVST